MERKMKRSLSMVLWGVFFTSVFAGALTLSTLKLWQTRFAKPPAGGASQGAVSAALAASPEMVGTENPVPANPTATPAPEVSNLAQNDSQLEPQPPREVVRAKAEQVRKKAERLRARVEGLYQGHRISEAAYRKGQAEYQQELAKYENQIAKYHAATTGSGAEND
jgi:hypothetical protein